MTESNSKEFQSAGYTVLTSQQAIGTDKLLSADTFAAIQKAADEAMPSWTSGALDRQPEKVWAYADNYEIYDVFSPRGIVGKDTDQPDLRFIGPVRLEGNPIDYRLARGAGPIEVPVSYRNNAFWGMKGILYRSDLPGPIVDVASSPSWAASAASLIGCDASEIELCGAELIYSYPGNTGEDGHYYFDTCRFTASESAPVTDRFLVKVILDLDPGAAPAALRLIPGSQKQYAAINSFAARCVGASGQENHIPPGRGLWEELLPDSLSKPVDVSGSAGQVTFIHSSLLYRITPNTSSNSTRKMMVFYLARKTDGFKDRHARGAEPPPHPGRNVVVQDGAYRMRELRRKLRALPQRLVRKGLRVLGKKEIKREYLNFGAGTRWKHPQFLTLDYITAESDIRIDLNVLSRLSLPDGLLKGVYSSHNIEHLKESVGIYWLKESHRILKKGGILRITAPDVPGLLRAYDQKDASVFAWVRRSTIYSYDCWLRLIVRMVAEPVVHKFSDEQLYEMYRTMSHEEFLNFLSSEVELVENHAFLNPGAHKTWWGAEKMIRVLKEIGFSVAVEVDQYKSSDHVFLQPIFNQTRPEMSFFVEARK